MITILILLFLLGQNKVSGQNCDGQDIDVVSFVNPDFEIGSHKKSLDDVPSLAILANDPRAAFPESFTICSDVLNVLSTKIHHLMFFNLLGRNGEQLWPSVMVDKTFYTCSQLIITEFFETPKTLIMKANSI